MRALVPTNLRPVFAGAILLGVAFGSSGCRARKVGALEWDPLEIELVEADRPPEAEGGIGSPGAPSLAGIVLSVVRDGEVVARGVTGPEGMLAFDHAFRDAVDVEVVDPEGRFARTTFRLTAPGRHALELRRGLRIRMRLESEAGAKIGASEITAWLAGGRVETFQVDALGDGSGSVSVGPLPEGPAKLVIAAPGHVAAILDVALERRGRRAKETVDLGTVRLRSGGSELRGRVRASERRAPDRVLLRYGGAGRFAPILPGGSFRIEGLPEAPGEAPADALDGSEATLVFLRDDQEVHARRVRLGGGGPAVDLGTIRLP
ncbi:MAG: hypothetical protein ACUVYA_02350 [Planctomycetota bacterium]